MHRMAASVLLSFSLAGADDWPSFRGGGAYGVGQGQAPTSWDAFEGTNIRWRTPLPGLGHSSPIVWGDSVFVTSAVSSTDVAYPTGLTEDLRSSSDTSEQDWIVYCIDRLSGAIRWQRKLASGVPRAPRHVKNSFATPTPATDGRRLLVFLGGEGLFGLTLQGELLWKRDLGALKAGFYLDPSLQWGIGTSPVIYERLAVLQIDGDDQAFLAAFDIDSGEPVWSTPRSDGRSWSSPAVYVGPPSDLLVTNAPKAVRAYDPRSGKELWHYRWAQDIVISTPLVAKGMIFTSSGKGPTQPILAIRPESRGDLTLRGEASSSEHVAWGHFKGGPIVTSPLVYDDWLYALVDIGVLRCFAAADGRLVYQQRLADSFLASPVAADGKVYLASESGDVFVIRAGPRFEILAVNHMGEPIVATPAIARGMIIVRTTDALYGIAAATGDRPGESPEGRSEIRRNTPVR
jgi:outer membrane protein assembly factor BamB